MKADEHQRFQQLAEQLGIKPTARLLDFYNRAHADGSRAMYDSIAYRAANNWHGRSSVNAVMQQENRIALDWARDALHEVNTDDYAEWVDINTARRQGAEDERLRHLLAQQAKPSGIFGIRRWIRNHV